MFRHHIVIAVIFLTASFASGSTHVLTPEPIPNPPEGSFLLQGACENGITLDDGSFETAYGWVPSVIWGEYVQSFDLRPYGSTLLEELCVCLSRTRSDDSIDFEVVLYESGRDTPVEWPVFSYPASVSGVPEWPDGRFYEIDLGNDVPAVPPGLYNIGIRWDPSVDQFFFICADQSPTADPVAGFFRDDRADGWASILESSDIIFDDHAAMVIRATVLPTSWVPTLAWYGVGLFAGLILLAGIRVFRLR